MGLLQEWREYAYGVELNSKEGKAIWDKYFEQEKAIYQQLLAAPEKVVSGTVQELADKYDMLILSPGISIHKPVAKAFYDRKKPVWGEIELAAHFAKGKIAAITGTNGKTTTTALVGSILREYYKSVFVVGNIGIPFTSVALDTTEDSVIAAEISSFQLETTIDFQPE